jgi:hypothetical protein
MKKGLLIFHQGYSDIISCLPLINYYANKYDNLKVIIRSDFIETVNFYVKDLKNVEICFFDITILRNNLNPLDLVQIDDETDRLFHGCYDVYRKINDPCRGKFNESIFYGVGFYEFYGVEIIEKIYNFSIDRDLEIERKLFNNVVGDNDTEYIVYHENDTDKIKKDSNYKYINLENLSKNIFESITILEKSKEIHIVDSVWAALCFLLDGRYQIFKNKKIYLYPFKERSGSCLWYYDKNKLNPFKPKNWVIV